MHWSPRQFLRFEECNTGCSTGIARILTDAGHAYIKALGNNEGPHALARDWIGTSVAKWFGLRTFDFAMFHIDGSFEIELGNGRNAASGHAFVTRAEKGEPWRASVEELRHVENVGDITKLVIVDTWLLNADR